MHRKNFSPTRFIISDRNGNVSILFAIFLIPVVGAMGLAVDFGRAMHVQTDLQEIADTAAIAGARLPATSNKNRYEAANRFLNASISLTTLDPVSSSIKADNAEVIVETSHTMPTVLMGLFGIDKLEIKAVSGARPQIENGGVACLLSLSPDSPDGLHLQGINQAAAKNCWAWVNSEHSESINAVGAAKATAQGFCTAGGSSGSQQFSPPPFTDCSPMEDPFADRFVRSYPDAATCTATNLNLKSGTYELSPGVYCGNTVLRPQANVTFKPGNYIFKDGYLEVQGQATAIGEGVTFYFMGAEATLVVRGGGNIDLKASSEGDSAGFVLVKRAEGHDLKEVIVQGGGDVRLVGILYAPEWRVNISGNGEINQNSPYFAMIADHFYMEGNGRLWINSDAASAQLPDLMPRIKSGPVLTR